MTSLYLNALKSFRERECYYLACPALRATVLARRGSLCMVWSTFAPGVLLSSRCCHPPLGFIDADYGYFPIPMALTVSTLGSSNLRFKLFLIHLSFVSEACKWISL
ncbi:hypothetical protein F2Q68_00008406 [Brassica cretica]|uniref:Uncharacterized protein n=1 Tax=Brassica cretica TaxID=69181 RepID=A0A8S9KQE6_BRACR|nr:hypothetical protein F2Q68_00008406 [Brassica cretica]